MRNIFMNLKIKLQILKNHLPGTDTHDEQNVLIAVVE